jgi:hypothetical protein
MLLSEGQMSDYKGARLIVDTLPPAKHRIAPMRQPVPGGLQDKGIEPYIPPRKNRKRKIEYDATLYKPRHKIENMFGKLKDW